MKILLFLNDPYPIGMANTNRMHLYAKGLLELGNDVLVLIPKPFERAGKINNPKAEGVFEGVRFKYAYKSTVRSNSFIGRRMHDLASLFNSFFYLIYFKPEIILFISPSFIHIILIKFYSIFKNVKLIREKSEVPFYHKEHISRIKKLRIKAEFNMFDGLTVITDELKAFFQKDLSLNLKILVVPIIVNISKQNLNRINTDNTKLSLVYTGSLIDHKDGILLIIRSYAKIIKHYPESQLIMTGDIDHSPDKAKIYRLLEDLNIVDKVVFTGYISKKELSEITSCASVLLLAKPNYRQNRYNMATKIGEYLLTGRPVVLSSVDPACNYLEHKKDALIAEPEVNSFTKEIKFVLDNPEKASQIGPKGKETALASFNSKIHISRINNFLRSIK